MSAGATPREERMPLSRILVGHDGSGEAQEAFESALELAALAHGRLQVVSVATPPEPPTDVETEAAVESATRHYEDIHENLRRQAGERDVPLDTRVLVGHPAEQILHLASETHADLIVVGYKGRSGIRQWLFGSTSRRVVSYAPCSVLVVRRK